MMPFNVLRCFECRTFQIHPQTKASKWRCKMCNEKQSFLKVFMTGTAPECRQTVQTLNMRQGEMESSWERTDTTSPQFSRTSLQTRSTGRVFSSAGSDQEDEIDHAADLGLMPPHAVNLGMMRPLSSVHSHGSNSSVNSGEVSRASDLVHRTGSSWLQTQAVGKKPVAFHAASNRQEKTPGGSKWTKFLDPVDADDSSSEDDSGSATATFHTELYDDENDDDNDDDETFSALGFKHRGFYSVHH